MLTTPEDDTIILSMILVDVLEESHVAPILWKLNHGGNIGCFRVTIVSAIARSQTKTLIARLVFTQWFQISEETSKTQRERNYFSICELKAKFRLPCLL